MSEFLTPQEFKTQLTTNPLFLITLIFENQPQVVTENMNDKGYYPKDDAEAYLMLKALLEQDKGSVVHSILSSVKLDFSKINEMYHAPLMEALNGK